MPPARYQLIVIYPSGGTRGIGCNKITEVLEEMHHTMHSQFTEDSDHKPIVFYVIDTSGE